MDCVVYGKRWVVLRGRSALYLIEVPVYLVPFVCLDQAGSLGRVSGRINHADSGPRDIAWLRMALVIPQESSISAAST